MNRPIAIALGLLTLSAVGLGFTLTGKAAGSSTELARDSKADAFRLGLTPANLATLGLEPSDVSGVLDALAQEGPSMLSLARLDAQVASVEAEANRAREVSRHAWSLETRDLATVSESHSLGELLEIRGQASLLESQIRQSVLTELTIQGDAEAVCATDDLKQCLPAEYRTLTLDPRDVQRLRAAIWAARAESDGRAEAPSWAESVRGQYAADSTVTLAAARRALYEESIKAVFAAR